jgi:hypothetical protein
MYATAPDRNASVLDFSVNVVESGSTAGGRSRPATMPRASCCRAACAFGESMTTRSPSTTSPPAAQMASSAFTVSPS